MFLRLIILALLMSGAGLWAQAVTVPAPAPFKLHDSRPNWDQFYHGAGSMQMVAGSDYLGTSLSLLRHGASRMVYSLNLDFLPVQVLPNALAFYDTPQRPYSTAMVMPIWMSVKVRLSNSSSVVTPYMIAGAGPALGLRFSGTTGWTNTISQVDGQWGGGAYLGAGLDYLWAGEWGLSADIRYNVLRFDSQVGTSDQYDGFSFSFGFVRAFR
ncbi:MAG TPA: OmpW family outer membrane protein [Calditrichia bacterium]|nr:hypothetical protein [Calditrichota bacterium]HQU72382.1 OmpW family outer membrane protein [Calditrichia bacterium]HQV33588.1 OmpW family outer membrane protein [Calditrichia bacterium]